MKLGNWFGFPVDADGTALIVLAFLVLQSAKSGPAGMAMGFAFAIGIFLSVMAHELGHALVARFFRLGPISITLSGFGGLTRYARAPKPWHGVLVTLAGPGAGFLLGGVLLVAGFFFPWGEDGALPLVWTLAAANIFLSVFNLLPMYPLDGGAVVSHALAIFIPRDAAMVWSARVGVPFALLAGAYAAWAGQMFMGMIVLFSLMRSVPLAFSSTTR